MAVLHRPHTFTKLRSPWVATENNHGFSGQLNRRFIEVRLVPKTETPHLLYSFSQFVWVQPPLGARLLLSRSMNDELETAFDEISATRHERNAISQEMGLFQLEI